MKNKRNQLIAACLLLIFVALVCWNWPKKQPTEVGEPSSKNDVIASTIKSKRPDQSPKLLTGDQSPPTNLIVTPEVQNIRRQESLGKSFDEWQTKIEFFGKIVDENEIPVEAAQVDFACNDLSETGTSSYHATSDGRGLFSINGIQGKLLTVKVSKAGYYSSKRDNDSFYYAGLNENFRPDASNPIIFRLKKIGQSERLVVMDYPGFAKIAKFSRDGTPVEFDLLKGTLASVGTGQVKFEFFGSPVEKTTKKFDWRLKITAVGGLFETDDEFPFQAPETGYVPAVAIDMPASLNDDWKNEVKKKYFVRLGDGRYGRIEFRLMARNGVVTLQSAANPSGSRNLEITNAARTGTPVNFE